MLIQMILPTAIQNVGSAISLRNWVKNAPIVAGSKICQSQYLLVLLRLDHVEEGIVEELLLEMRLEVEQRHVQQIHRLVEAWIDLELLLELSVLGEPLPHAPFPMLSPAKRERSRADSVGPR